MTTLFITTPCAPTQHNDPRHVADGSHDMATRPPLLAERPVFNVDETQRIPVMVIYLDTDNEALRMAVSMLVSSQNTYEFFDDDGESKTHIMFSTW